eukprot:TRINITY_DN10160_c0_g1_i1.p1 TRINITY_DN10160_c0_g1~~TRINITY_DN10160_c0_g1_i1.p1  ORF type:complete len:799 (-),score=241.48 TRINITY_DN10160_c0_g1_i1:178-2574(-)
MGNNNVSLKQYPTKWSFQNPFSNSETLYLWTSFMRITNGKDKFSFSSFLKLCLTYRPNTSNISNYDQVSKTLFRIMDIDSDDIIHFEDYLQTCFIITRGCIESKLEMLFYLLKDQIGGKMSKINMKKRLQDLRPFVCPLRSKEMKIKFAEGDISKELKILDSLYQDDEKQILEQTFIQRFFKKVNEALHMICILELMILPLTFGVENKMKTKIYKLPLLYINAYELHRQSHARYYINQRKTKTESANKNEQITKTKRVLIKPHDFGEPKNEFNENDDENNNEISENNNIPQDILKIKPKDNKSTSNDDIKKSTSSTSLEMQMNEISFEKSSQDTIPKFAISNDNIPHNPQSTSNGDIYAFEEEQMVLEEKKDSKKNNSGNLKDFKKNIMISQKNIQQENRIPTLMQSTSILQKSPRVKNFAEFSELSYKNLRNLSDSYCLACCEYACKCNQFNSSSFLNSAPVESALNFPTMEEDEEENKKRGGLKRFKPKHSINKKIPLGIYLLCRALIKEMRNVKITASEFEGLIWKKPDKTNCQAIQAAFEVSYAHSVNLTDKNFTIPELLHTLKNILTDMPAPLMTWSLSITALSISLEKTGENERKVFLKNLLESIPSSNLVTIKCIVDCFSSISNGDPKIQMVLSSFFGNCFVRFADSEDRLAYSPFESLNLKSSLETTPKDFVNFLLEEKSIFSQFNFNELSDFIDESITTPMLYALVSSSRHNLSYSDHYINPLLKSNKNHSIKTIHNQSSSYSTESFYISSNPNTSSHRSDSKNSLDLEEVNFVKKSNLKKPKKSSLWG